MIADLPTITLKDQAEFAAEQRAPIDQLLLLIYALLGLAVVIAVLGNVKTLALSVIERTREVGLLRAVGMSRRQLRTMVRLESMVISLLGAVLGVILSPVFGIALQRSQADGGDRGVVRAWGSARPLRGSSSAGRGPRRRLAGSASGQARCAAGRHDPLSGARLTAKRHGVDGEGALIDPKPAESGRFVRLHGRGASMRVDSHRREQQMAIWIDPPAWPAHGRLWSHLISDTSSDELVSFAARAGIPARGFEGDHFDVPQERYAGLVAAGARPVGGKELARLLRDSGLRFQKRKGERPLAALRNVLPQVDVGHSLHVVASTLSTPDEFTAATAVFVTDAEGATLLVHTVARDAWGAPAGGREPGETVLECATRETWEEAGLRIDPSTLARCGYERVTFDEEPSGRWPNRRNYVACFATVLKSVAPPVAPHDADVDAAEWVPWPEVERRCSSEFWWPLLASLSASTTMALPVIRSDGPARARG